jgi:hypothetical protein
MHRLLSPYLIGFVIGLGLSAFAFDHGRRTAPPAPASGLSTTP